MVDHDYYFDTLYPLQDEVLAVLAGLETGFYLTGGTAASRLYLQHRFSDDLDFFVNDQPEFILWAERLIQAAENILANKVTAVLGREEPKDLADIWGFCCQMGLPLTAALESAGSKAAGIFAPDLARVLVSASATDWESVRWITPPDVTRFVTDLHQLGEQILLV